LKKKYIVNACIIFFLSMIIALVSHFIHEQRNTKELAPLPIEDNRFEYRTI